MQRRGFIKRLFGVATAVVVSEKIIPDDGVALHSIAHPESSPFGLAPPLPEGSAIAFDPLPDVPIRTAHHGIMSRADFAECLSDSLNKAFTEHYSDLSDDSLETMWVEIDEA